MMKKQFLFSALLCGAMLASCSVKEDLSVSVNPVNESPVFTVAMDGDAATRADLVLENAKVSFVPEDKMSLYHGITDIADFTGYENAVYEGYAGSDENAMEFTTHAMVKPGYAVMVYPADLTFANKGGAAPQISIDLEGQTKETADNTPYVSEILNIKDFDATKPNDNATAGYGRKYDLLLKRLASTLLLTLKENGKAALPAGVAPLAVTGVEINASSTMSGVQVFTNTVALKADADIKKPATGDVHPMWIKQVDVNVVSAESTIKTKYVENNVAVFTMLPFKNTASASIVAPTITVYTNYGSVTVDGKSTNENVWVGDAETANAKGTIVDGLKFLANNLYGEVSKSSGFYNTVTGAVQTKAGKAAKRTLLVDYSNLDMNGTHITSSEQLIDVLKVYDALAKNDDFNTEVEFFLDGDEEGKFYMTEDALKAYTAHIGKKSDITFTPCTDNGEECEIVVLTTEAGAEVPVALDFSSDVVVELEGAWTFAGEHAFNGVSEVVVPDGSTVTLSGTVAVATTLAIVNAYNISETPAVITVEEGGKVVTTGNVTLKFATTNYGTINVPANTALLMNTATLTNSYTVFTGDAAKNKTGYALLKSEGVINVEGRLASTTGGNINNYGVVNMKSADAYIYLTNNATSGASYGNAFDNSKNVFGSVVLNDKTGNENVNISGEQGFIKLELNQATVTDKDLGSIANYAILKGAIETYDALTVGENETVQNKIKYLEVNSTKQVKIVGKYASSNKRMFDGLWVHEGSNVNIPTGSQVTVLNAYLQGYVYCAGTWYDGVKYVTYFGNGNEDHYAYTGK